MSFFGLVLGVLGVWRITHLLNAEDGPWDAIVRMRRAAGDGFWADVLDCFYCLSLWVAMPFAIVVGSDPLECLLLWPALSGAGILLERVTAPAPPAEAPFWKEEDTDGMLRSEQAGVEAGRQDGRSNP